MSSLLQSLENNEAILLMYLADELPQEDRLEVAQMLAIDAGLRAELERLRESYETLLEQISRADESIRLAVPQSVAVRRVTKLIRARGASELPRPSEQKAARKLWFPWWAYPTAAAASVALAVWVYIAKPFRPSPAPLEYPLVRHIPLTNERLLPRIVLPSDDWWADLSEYDGVGRPSTLMQVDEELLALSRPSHLLDLYDEDETQAIP